MLDLRQMREDLMELTGLLTASHPDPYRGPGGKVAFHRQVENIRRVLPEAAYPQEFLRIVRPLVASLRDGHTAIGLPTEPASHPLPRLWLDWDVIGDTLYLRRVYSEAHRQLLGARLEAAGGFAMEELKRRMARLHGYDNGVDLLRRLGEALSQPAECLELLGCDDPPKSTTLALQLGDGTEISIEVPWSTESPGAPLDPPSTLPLPPLGPANLGWGFLGGDGKVAYLRVGQLMQYREAFEVWRAGGFTQTLEERLRALLPDASPADDVDVLLCRIPSATELLQELFAAMREAKAKELVVDLREATGGNSALAHILGCFLFGEDEMAFAQQGYQIPRHSRLYLANYGSLPDGADPANGGYDFRDEEAFEHRRRDGLTDDLREQLRAEAREYALAMPTFDAALRDGKVTGAEVRRLSVVTSAFTYSAGFDVAAMLVRRGALHVGVASGQAGNCFTDILRFRLAHSQLAGTISFKESFLFPEDPAAGCLLRPQRELTYERLAAYGFDPNASLRLALDDSSGE